MPQLSTRTLKERKMQEELREKEIQQVFCSRNKALENSKRDKKQKKKSADELLSLLDLNGIEGKTLRPVNTFIPRSHNLDKQLAGLLNHMFARYHVPVFLYQACLKNSDDPFNCMGEMYRQWFVTLAQGGSFPKLVRGLLTSKEAFLFLSAPATNRIHENV